jgi:hypothetical protein
MQLVYGKNIQEDILIGNILILTFFEGNDDTLFHKYIRLNVIGVFREG